MSRFMAVAVTLVAMLAFADDKKPAEAKGPPAKAEAAKGEGKGEAKGEGKAEGKGEGAKAEAGKPEAHPAPPPEVKKTTDAFVGNWSGEATMEMGGKTEKTKAKMDCKKIALGGGAACTMTGKTSMGPLEESCMAAYDPEGKAVHFMCVTSMGEVHDHKGSWTDDKTLVMDAFKGSMGGKPMTEDVSFSWADAKTMTSTAIITMADGSKMTFSTTAKRK